MSDTSDTWADVEPWFEDLDDWFAFVTTSSRLHPNPRFSPWKLVLIIRSQAYESYDEKNEREDADVGDAGVLSGSICTKELATRLRELLAMIQSASMSSNQRLWNEIVSHELGRLNESSDTVDYSLPSLMRHFSLCFKCEASRDHVLWLRMFVDEFFRPMNELATLPEFRETMRRMNHMPVHSEMEVLLVGSSTERAVEPPAEYSYDGYDKRAVESTRCIRLCRLDVGDVCNVSMAAS